MFWGGRPSCRAFWVARDCVAPWLCSGWEGFDGTKFLNRILLCWLDSSIQALLVEVPRSSRTSHWNRRFPSNGLLCLPPSSDVRHYSTALVYLCNTAPVNICHTAPVYICNTAPIYFCNTASVNICNAAPVYICKNGLQLTGFRWNPKKDDTICFGSFFLHKYLNLTKNCKRVGEWKLNYCNSFEHLRHFIHRSYHLRWLKA